jgi:fumarate hydratase class II
MSTTSTTDRFRTERDTMGEMRVPASALWGPQTQRAVENFPISGEPIPRPMIRALGLIKAAAARVNGELGMLAPAMAQAIESAAQAVAAGKHDAEFPIDVFQTGSGTSSNMNANEVIAHLAARQSGLEVHPNDHVNFGQSSNDVIPTALHVATVLEIERELLPALDRLAEGLGQKAREFDGVIKTGRTHLMDATPIRVGQEFSTMHPRSHMASPACRRRFPTSGSWRSAAPLSAPVSTPIRNSANAWRPRSEDWPTQPSARRTTISKPRAPGTPPPGPAARSTPWRPA